MVRDKRDKRVSEDKHKLYSICPFCLLDQLEMETETQS